MHNHSSRWASLLCAALAINSVAAAEPYDTATVRLIQQIGPAVVPIFVEAQDGSGSAGSGAVIHRAGYIITADHVTAAKRGVVLFGLNRVEFKSIGRLPEKDLAIIKVDPAHVTSVIQLATDREIKAGEPIILAGNPGGRGITYSLGIISDPHIDPTWPSVLTRTYWRTQAIEDEIKSLHSPGGRPTFMQFDAGSNRGNSGGPLVGYDARLVGIASSKSPDEEAINWAVPCERIKVCAPWLLQPEIQEDFYTGITVNTLLDTADVTAVATDSPAWAAGIRPGDRLTAIDDQPIATGIDYLLLLYGHAANDQLKLAYTRKAATATAALKLTKYAVAKPLAADGMQSGLDYAMYVEAPEALPDFSQFKAVKKGSILNVTLQGIPHDSLKEFSLQLTGYVEFPQAGLYRMHLSSDDSSKLYVDGHLAINNDLTHPYQEASAWIRVDKGLTPITIEYADKGGQRELTLLASTDVDGKQPVELKFYHAAKSK